MLPSIMMIQSPVQITKIAPIKKGGVLLDIHMECLVDIYSV